MDKNAFDVLKNKVDQNTERYKESIKKQKIAITNKINDVKAQTASTLKADTAQEKKNLARLAKETKAVLNFEKKKQNEIKKQMAKISSESELAMLQSKLNNSVAQASLAKLKHNSTMLAKAAKLNREKEDALRNERALEEDIKKMEAKIDESLSRAGNIDLKIHGNVRDQVIGDPATYPTLLANAEEHLIAALLAEVPEKIRTRVQDIMSDMDDAVVYMSTERKILLQSPTYKTAASITIDSKLVDVINWLQTNKVPGAPNILVQCERIIDKYRYVLGETRWIQAILTRDPGIPIDEFYQKNFPSVTAQGEQVMKKIRTSGAYPYRILAHDIVATLLSKAVELHQKAADYIDNPWHPMKRRSTNDSQLSKILNDTKIKTSLMERNILARGSATQDVTAAAAELSAQATASQIGAITDNVLLRGGRDILESKMFIKPDVDVRDASSGITVKLDHVTQAIPDTARRVKAEPATTSYMPNPATPPAAPIPAVPVHRNSAPVADATVHDTAVPMDIDNEATLSAGIPLTVSNKRSRSQDDDSEDDGNNPRKRFAKDRNIQSYTDHSPGPTTASSISTQTGLSRRAEEFRRRRQLLRPNPQGPTTKLPMDIDTEANLVVSNKRGRSRDDDDDDNGVIPKKRFAVDNHIESYADHKPVQIPNTRPLISTTTLDRPGTRKALSSRPGDRHRQYTRGPTTKLPR